MSTPPLASPPPAAAHGPAAHGRWRDALHALAHSTSPLFVFDDAATPAASIWTGARAYVRTFRDAGLVPGDRLLLALPPSAAFVQALVAGLWEGLTVVPAPAGASDRTEVSDLLEVVDARAAVLPEAGPHAWAPDDVGGPTGAPVLRPTVHGPTPDARFLLRTSGTSGAPTWIALSDANVWAVVDAHREPLGLRGARVLSVLPWHHAFGLILDLIPALLWADEIVRDPNHGRDAAALVALAEASETTHLSTVPLVVRRLAATPGGPDLLGRLGGGIVGGAPITADVAQAMHGTALRVGYGQTEASPGIALGQAGHGAPNLLGRELGCTVRLDADGVLAFRGPNAALGTWSAASGLARLDPDRWVRTLDHAERRGGDLYFRGRAGDAFKLDNGRFVRAGDIEARLRSDVPGVLDAALSTPDGHALDLDLLVAHDAALPEAAVRDTLGPHRYRLHTIRAHTRATWPTLPKGTVDRRALHTPSPAMPSATALSLGPNRPLDVRRLEQAAIEDRPSVSLTDRARSAMSASRRALDAAVAAGRPVYGITTGFGPHVCSPASGGTAHGDGLTAHLAAGWGGPAPAPVVRATMMVRAQQLAQGHSGLAPEVATALLGLARAGIVPFVPTVGSVGASGDLTPLAHIARVLTGSGFAVDTVTGERIPATTALAQAGLEPLALSGREALGLVNGTAFMTAYLALAVAQAERLIARTERLVGWAYRALGCRRQALDARVHEARGHAGQIRSAAAIRAEVERGTEAEDPSRPLQEVYVLRCAPQVLGACRENVAFARRIVEAEMNGVSDNPVIADDLALHGGNFQGQQIAFAADTLNASIVQTGVFAERLLDALTDPKRGVVDAPLLLAYDPGPTSGLAGAQMTATALVAELRHHAQMASTSSIPTNAGNQDVVSMGTLAGRTAYEQAERLSPILATVGIALSQLSFLRAERRAPGRPVPAPAWMPAFEGLRQDRPLYDDIARIAEAWMHPAPASAPAVIRPMATASAAPR
ncbi:MAG: aromatic amino acid lyase, partial [Bacteroidota bacterium]